MVFKILKLGQQSPFYTDFVNNTISADTVLSWLKSDLWKTRTTVLADQVKKKKEKIEALLTVISEPLEQDMVGKLNEGCKEALDNGHHFEYLSCIGDPMSLLKINLQYMNNSIIQFQVILTLTSNSERCFWGLILHSGKLNRILSPSYFSYSGN